MRTSDVRFLAAMAALLALGCGEKRTEAPPAPPPAAAPAPQAAPEAAPPAQPATPEPQAAPPAPQATAPKAPAPAPAPAAKSPPAPAATAPKAPEPAAAAPPAPKPPEPAAPPPAPPAPEAKPPAAPAPGAAHAKVGDAKCKVCHRIQHQSWAASPHAAKGLDCEGCHGNGGDYWPASVMRDRAKATAAGLVTPTLASCAKCHPKADAALFAKVHAHKAR